MNLLFDGLLLAVAVVVIIIGAKRGFIKSIMGICTLVAALFVAFAFTPTVSVYIEETAFMRDISGNISDTITSLSQNEEDSYNLSRLFSEMPDAFKQILDRYNANERELADAISPTPDADKSTVDDLSTMIADPVVSAVSGVLAFLALFVLSVIVLKLLTWILDLVFQLPVLKTANTLLGLVVGVLNALVWMWVLSALSVIFIRAMSSVSPEYFSETLIENTVLLQFFATDGFGNVLRMVIG